MYKVRAAMKQKAKKPLGRRSIPFRFVGGGESGRWSHLVRPSEGVSGGLDAQRRCLCVCCRTDGKMQDGQVNVGEFSLELQLSFSCPMNEVLV